MKLRFNVIKIIYFDWSDVAMLTLAYNRSEIFQVQHYVVY